MSIVATINGKKLTIVTDLEAPHASKSGLTQIVASSGGPKKTEAQVGGKDVTVNLQAWIK